MPSQVDPIVELTERPIEESKYSSSVTAPESGAVLTFRGVVRNHHHGRGVVKLVYSAYRPMALAKMRELAETLRSHWPIQGVAIVHRLGTLEVGEVSILVELSLAHRKEGFAALEFSLDYFKREVPIWKKEHFVDGVSEWVHQSA